ncbi:hypothetical protein ADL05_24365 [Nocardiopsis sp. NRRL B-16309]|nr:hypothetical protein ADL05_24365 [Nocardiopsis sp. NRRL B-16309]
MGRKAGKTDPGLDGVGDEVVGEGAGAGEAVGCCALVGCVFAGQGADVEVDEVVGAQVARTRT